MVSTLQNKVTGCKWTKLFNSSQKAFLAALGQICQKKYVTFFLTIFFFSTGKYSSYSTTMKQPMLIFSNATKTVESYQSAY